MKKKLNPHTGIEKSLSRKSSKDKIPSQKHGLDFSVITVVNKILSVFTYLYIFFDSLSGFA